MTKLDHVYIDDYLQDVGFKDVFEVEAPLVSELKNKDSSKIGVSLDLLTTSTEYINFDDNLQVLKVQDGK